MSGRLFHSLALLYPKTWRERYADEVADLSAELLAAGEVTRPRLMLELLGSAFAERVRSLHRSRFAVLLSGGAALVVVVAAAFFVTNDFGLGSTSPRVTSGLKVTAPAGWVPVAYGDAQVSAPALFMSMWTRGGGSAVEVTYNKPTSIWPNGVCLGPPGATVVCLFPVHQVPMPYARERPTIINGVPVYAASSGEYYAPSLGVEVIASVPQARRIVDTLTRR